MTIHIIEGHLETDVFAKDIPIYLNKKSCHPPFVFSAVAQSVALRLRTNCSLDRFLTPRIEEYTRYLMASDYSREEVGEVMEEARNRDRLELIKGKRNNNNRRKNTKKYVLCSKWDPRQPNVKEGLKLMEEILYLNEENKKAFPKGSIIAGFRRQRNLGEIIAPSKPKRVAGGAGGGGGCFPCDAPRACTLHQSGALQFVTRIQSRYDGVWHTIRKRMTCATPNVIYYIFCPCGHPTDYVGSTNDMKRRWSGHKTDIRSQNWKACGLTRHFGDHHTGDMEVAISNLEVTLVDCLLGDYDEKRLKRLEDKWMVNLGTLFTGANSRNEVLSNRRRNFGGS